MKNRNSDSSLLNLISNNSSIYKVISSFKNIKKDIIALLTSTLLINFLALAMPLALLQVYDRILPNKAYNTLGWLISGVIIALFFEVVIKLTRGSIGNWISARFDHILGVEVFEHLLSSKLNDFSRTGAGVHMERLNAVNTLRSYYSGQVIQIFLDLPFAVLFLFVQYYIGGPIVFYTLTIVVLFLIIIAYSKRKYEKYKTLHQNVSDHSFNFIMETLGGIHTVKSNTMEEQMLRRYESILSGSSALLLKQNIWNNFPQQAGYIASQLNLLGILAISAAFVINGNLTIGAMTACTMLGARVMQPILQMARFWFRRADAQIATNQLAQLAEMTPDIINADQSSIEDIEGKLHLENVSFTNDNTGQTLLKNISLDVKPGEIVGIKSLRSEESSSLALLACGIYRTDKGKVMIDDYNIGHWDHSHFNGRVEYIPRNGQLFRGTIIDNICMFNYSKRFAAHDTASLLRLDEMVADLPNGYETEVTPTSNTSLPKGLIQRICIARALVTRPRLIIFDRTLHALDRDSLELVTKLINTLRGTCTVLIISDSESYLEQSDKTFELVNGELKDLPKVAHISDGMDELSDNLSSEETWKMWIMQTASRWEDLSSVIRNTGIEIIDKDHQRLAEYAMEINNLVHDIENRELDMEFLNKEKVILKTFYNYTVEHFSREEVLIGQLGLKDLELQKEQHKKILTMFRNILMEFNDGRMSMTSDLKSKLLEWIINHINQVDYYTFRLENLLPYISKSQTWNDLKDIVRPTGIPFIDDAHIYISTAILTISSMLDQMINRPITKDDKARINTEFSELLNFADKHFSRENKFLKSYDLPGQNLQKTLHDLFVVMLIEKRDEILNSTEINENTIKTSLLKWWINHTNRVDQSHFKFSQLSKYLLEKVESSKEISWMIRKTGIKSIDSEHIQMVDLVLKTANSSKTEAFTIFKKINNLVETHFSNEETILQNASHPDLVSHREEHRHLKNIINEHLALVETGKAEISPRFRRRMMSWWIHHTNGTDYETFVLHIKHLLGRSNDNR